MQGSEGINALPRLGAANKANIWVAGLERYCGARLVFCLCGDALGDTVCGCVCLFVGRACAYECVRVRQCVGQC